MPIYVYACSTCSAVQEAIQPLDAPATLPCPSGCPEPMQRVPTAPSIAFVGGGWFREGYAATHGQKLS